MTAERKEPLKKGTKVSVKVYEDDMRRLNGVVSERSEDRFSDHPVRYGVKVIFDENAESVAPRGSPLPPNIKRKYSSKSTMSDLRKGVEGTTSFFWAPAQLLEVKSGFFDCDNPLFEIRHVPITGALTTAASSQKQVRPMIAASRGGLPQLLQGLQDYICRFLARDIWVSWYEPSTTGWGDNCSFQFFWDPSEADVVTRKHFKDRVNFLRVNDYPDKMAMLDRTTVPTQFRRVPAKKLMRPKYPVIRKINMDFTENPNEQCFAKTVKNNLFVAISNFHGDDMNGIADPYMAEWYWVEKRQINAGVDLSSNGGNLSRKRHPQAKFEPRPVAKRKR